MTPSEHPVLLLSFTQWLLAFSSPNQLWLSCKMVIFYYLLYIYSLVFLWKKSFHPSLYLFLLALLFIFNFLKFLVLLYFALQYCIGFAIHWPESATGVHELPILNLPPHIISPDHPHAPAPSILYSVSNIDWRLLTWFMHFLYPIFKFNYSNYFFWGLYYPKFLQWESSINSLSISYHKRI